MTLERKKPLRRSTPLPRNTKPLARSSLKPGQRLRSVGARASRNVPAWMACKNAVHERSGGMCEAGCGYPGGAVHHMWPSDRKANRHEPERCMHLCADCHRKVHTLVVEDPARPGEQTLWGYVMGYLFRSWE